MVEKSSRRLMESVTSDTGAPSFPCSIIRPKAPRLKSPVEALKPKPIMPSQKKPCGVAAIISSWLTVPGRSDRLKAVSPGEPLDGRLAWPVGFMPSLRAE